MLLVGAIKTQITLKDLKNNFTNYQSLLSREAYEFYRLKRRKVAVGINDYNLYKKAVNGLFNVIKDMMVESEGGVYLDGFGYLCMIAYPKEYKCAGKKVSLFQRIKRYQYYFPYLIPDVEIENWTMSDSFEDKLERKMNAQDIKYKLHFDIVETMRIAQDYTKKSVDSRKVRGEFRYNSRLIKKLNK